MKRLTLVTVLGLMSLCGMLAQNPLASPNSTEALQTLMFYSGSNLQYVCTAKQNQPTATSVKRSDSTLTSVVVLTNVGTVTTATAHGLYIGARVTVSGATVDSDLNASYVVLSIPSTTTYTITTVNVGDATYNEATLAISTRNPRDLDKLWAIQVLTYTGSNLTAVSFANANPAFNTACTDRTQF